MPSTLHPSIQSPLEDSEFSEECQVMSVDLILSYVNCSSTETLVQFQGQYPNICELDYDILQVEIQDLKKTAVCLDVGELCLVEDVLSHQWYRGRVQSKCSDQCDVFLLDYGNVLTVGAGCLALVSDDLLTLPPKIVCGFFASVLPWGDGWDELTAKYFASLIGTEIKGHIRATLPPKVVILEVPAVIKDLLRLNLGKPVDGDTFLVLVEIITKLPLMHSSKSALDILTSEAAGQEPNGKPSRARGLDNLLSLHGPKLSVGSEQRVRISSAVNTGVFFCQLESMVTKLVEMTDRLSRFCEVDDKDLCNKPVGNLGLLCSVKWIDEKWHRAIVQDLPVGPRVQVQFVDYGCCKSLKIENIRQLPPDFLSVPVMAFYCALSCARGQNEDVQKEQKEHLKRGLLGGVLLIHIDHLDIGKNMYFVTLKSVEADDHVESREINSLSTFITTTTFCKKEKCFSQSACAVEYINLDCLKDIEEKSTFTGFVEHVVNPSDFWLRMEERNCSFDDLMNKMKTHFDSIQLHEEDLEHPVPGALCSAMYEKDMCFYRAVVTEVAKNGAEVFFIDFGNSQKVPYMLIKKLPPELAVEPGFAINCSLAHVTSVQDVWTVCDNDFFRQAVLGKVFFVHVVQKKEDGLVVELYEREANVSINNLMVKEKMATLWKSKVMNCGLGRYAKHNAKHVLRNSWGKPQKCAGQRMLQNVAKVGNAAVTTREPVEHETGAQSLDAQRRVGQTFTEQTFQPGSERAVRCCSFSAPLNFWCQDQSKRNQLDDLMSKMQQYYQTHDDPCQPAEVCCVVKGQDDGRWYRGRVTGTDNGDCLVTLVDFGINVRQKAHDLRAIKLEFLQLETQAFRCSICHLMEPTGKLHDVWSVEASGLLKDFIQNSSQNLKCAIYSVVAVNNVLYNVVDLYTPERRATELLIESNFVKKEHYPQALPPSVQFLSYVFSMFNMQIGSKESVYVTHVCSAWNLYFQLERNGKMFEDLMAEVKNQSNDVRHESFTSGKAKLCLAKYIDGQWYRGLAFPVQSSMHVNVLFVDYGNMEVVEKSNIRPIPRHALKLLCWPMQALRCRLFGVTEGMASPDVKTWLENCTLNTLLQATVVAKEDDGTLVCELFDGNLHLNEKLRELMSTHKLKEQTHFDGSVVHFKKPDLGVGEPSVGDGTKECARPNIKLEKMCHSKRNQNSFKRVQSNSFKLGARHLETACMSHQKTMGNTRAAVKPRGSTAFRHHQGKEACTPLKQKTTSVMLPKITQLPESAVKPGFKGVGYVSHVNSVTSFYIQMENDENTILGLVKELNSAQFREETESIPRNVGIGDLIAAEYSEDKSLYRAFVTDVGDDHLRVEFIDYGNEAVVKKDSALILTHTFLTQPQLSINCSHEMLHSFGDDVSFSELVTHKPIMVEFIRKCGSQWNVIIQILEGLSADEMPSMQSCIVDSLVDIVSNSESNGREPGDGVPSIITCPAQDCCSESTWDDNAIKTCLQQMESKKRMCLNCDVVEFQGTEQEMSDRCANSVKVCTNKSLKHRPKVTESTTQSLSSTDIQDVNIPHQNITSGQTEDGRVLSVLVNGNIYVELNQNTDILALLDELLQRLVLECGMVSAKDISKGYECLVKSSKNGRWCRGVVQKVFSDDGKCSVFLLDHGTLELVSTDCVREHCKGVNQIPAQAILCKWEDLTKPNGEEYENAELLNSIMEQDIKITFLSYSECSQLWMVKVMIKTCLSKSVTDVGKNTEEAGHLCLKQSANNDLNMEDSCLVPRLSLAPVKTDVSYSGLAVAIASPCEFFVILNNLLLTKNIVSAALEELHDELVSLPDAFLIPGACCLIRPQGMNKWCRGEILQVDHCSVVVSLVDYGPCAQVHRHELKRLPDVLADIPKVIHSCVLRAVKPAGADHWSDEAIVFFQERMGDSKLVIYFRQYASGTQWEVDVVSQGVSFAEALVSAGHATYVDDCFELSIRQESLIAEAPLEECNPTSCDLTTACHPDLGSEFTPLFLESLGHLEEFKVEPIVDHTRNEHSELQESTGQTSGSMENCSCNKMERNELECACQETKTCVQM